jgi:hypothetical protein
MIVRLGVDAIEDEAPKGSVFLFNRKGLQGPYSPRGPAEPSFCRLRRQIPQLSTGQHVPDLPLQHLVGRQSDRVADAFLLQQLVNLGLRERRTGAE